MTKAKTTAPKPLDPSLEKWLRSTGAGRAFPSDFTRAWARVILAALEYERRRADKAEAAMAQSLAPTRIVPLPHTADEWMAQGFTYAQQPSALPRLTMEQAEALAPKARRRCHCAHADHNHHAGTGHCMVSECECLGADVDEVTRLPLAEAEALGIIPEGRKA